MAFRHRPRPAPVAREKVVEGGRLDEDRPPFAVVPAEVPHEKPVMAPLDVRPVLGRVEEAAVLHRHVPDLVLLDRGVDPHREA